MNIICFSQSVSKIKHGMIFSFDYLSEILFKNKLVL